MAGGRKFFKRYSHPNVAIDYEFRHLIESLNKFVDSQQNLIPNLPPGPRDKLLIGRGDGPVDWADIIGFTYDPTSGFNLNSGFITNTHINSAAAIDVSKLSLTTGRLIIGASNVGSAVTKASITLDEWGQPVANIAMNSKKFTGLAAGTANGDSIRYDQHNVSGLTDVGALSLTEGMVFYYNGTNFVLGYRPVEMTVLAGTQTWTNMPAATTEFLGVTLTRRIFDTTTFKQFRLQTKLSTAGFAGAKIRLEYSVNSGSSWAQAEDTTTTGDVDVSTGTGPLVGTWVNLVSGARAGSVWFRIVGLSGDGIVDPVFNYCFVQFR